MITRRLDIAGRRAASLLAGMGYRVKDLRRLLRRSNTRTAELLAVPREGRGDSFRIHVLPVLRSPATLEEAGDTMCLEVFVIRAAGTILPGRPALHDQVWLALPSGLFRRFGISADRIEEILPALQAGRPHGG